MKAVLILLAAGLSRRFGAADKLMEDLGGRPLLEHAAETLAGMEAAGRVAVCPADRPEIAARLADRFTVAQNDAPERGQGRSIAVGVKAAMAFQPDAVVICLADMPFVENGHIEAMLARLGGVAGRDIVHSGGEGAPRPPVAFAAACLPDLMALDGDGGARTLLKGGRYRAGGVAAPEAMLADVDTAADLKRAGERLKSGA